ncbi:MAG: Bro-N domain-containing protein [Candidatus Woesearchaeota archaeon]
MEQEKALVVFQDKNIRRVWHNDEWWYSVADIIGVLIDSEDSRTYWKVLKHRLLEEGSNETVTNCNQLKLVAEDGKMRETDCANTKSLFRIIQSIPSPKAEPFKQWLAQLGQERIEEIQNPELGQNRIRKYYELKGYPMEWIEKRIRGIAIRQELVDEWKARDVGADKEFAILTDEISLATFGKTVQEHKEFKGLNNQNLRDHMNDWELIFTMIGEKATTDIAKVKDSQGFDQNKEAAQIGGGIASHARVELEKVTGKPVISASPFLVEGKRKKMIENK